MSKLEYNTLNPERREIRLLKLLPPRSGPSPARSALVNCTLEHVSLDDEPQYQALSYVWGDPALTMPNLRRWEHLPGDAQSRGLAAASARD